MITSKFTSSAIFSTTTFSILENTNINFTINEKDNEINIFFDADTFNLIGWQTIDIYQNISITYLSSIKRNQKLKENLFLLPQKK